jgi:hypothetical protein
VAKDEAHAVIAVCSELETMPCHIKILQAEGVLSHEHDGFITFENEG